jgi:hypothetical protein
MGGAQYGGWKVPALELLGESQGVQVGLPVIGGDSP